MIIPFVDVLHRVSLRIVTMPIQSQGIITRDNVSVDVSAVAYFRVIDAVKSVVAIENVNAAINQIAQTTLRKVVGQHTLDETLSETDRINVDIREILDITTTAWGVEVTLVELKDIQLPEGMKRAMARQAEAEREKRAKIINAEGEAMAAASLGNASDVMMAHPLALQLRNLQSLVEIGVDKNTTVVFPAPLMSTIGELGSFLARETAASNAAATVGTVTAGNGSTPARRASQTETSRGRSADDHGRAVALDVVPSAGTCEVVRAPTYGRRPMTDPTPNRPGESTFRLMYRSRNLVPQDQRKLELGHLFSEARSNNKKQGITGALLLSEDWFVQVLEGDEDAVRALFSRIERDARHDSVAVLEAGQVPARVFARWAMAKVAEHGSRTSR